MTQLPCAKVAIMRINGSSVVRLTLVDLLIADVCVSFDAFQNNRVFYRKVDL
jgi:hypothetical protein